MTIIKPACAVLALFAFAACDRPQSQSRSSSPGFGTPGTTATTGVPTRATVTTPTSPTPGDPTAPTAARPQGAASGVATGGGVPVPTRPGGAGGVGSGNQPSQGGTGGGGSR